ncbi:MAG: hypothetical protein ABIJ61_06540 [bacterium]
MRRKSVILSLMIFLLATAVALGVSNLTGKFQRTSTALGLTEDLTIDANALEMFVYNNGNFAYDNISVYKKIDGLYFPRGTKKTVIYAAGLWLGARVNGEEEARIAQAEYSSEFIPGNMENGTYNPNWQDDQYRVYKIKRGDNASSNPDYAEWPAGDGAPVDNDGNPALLGDQLLWSVYNDADASGHQNESGGTEPLGVEVQQSTFAFARSGALGDCIFMKFKFINKGSNDFEDMYVSIWSDPDLGDAGNDLVGCDTTLSLGYCYNEGADDIYGAAPPAVGFDFFQGPIVPDADTFALVSGDTVWGYRNLPMTSFAKYVNGEDPRSSAQTYDFMKGLRKNAGTGLMEPAVNPITGDTSTFVLSGDPVTETTQTGWLDGQGSDRRFMMSSGPFNMAPGDTQEVVCAVLVGQGTNPLNSITVLRTTDVAAQTVFDLNFDIPSPPPSPTVHARGGDKFIDLTWGTEAVGAVDTNEALNQEFHFEGFNLYQGETAVGPWHKFATYDREDDASWVCEVICDTTRDSITGDIVDIGCDSSFCSASLIYGDVVDPAAGGSQRVISQKGSDSGLEFHLTVDRDQVSGAALESNRAYYYAVTAYSYDYRNITPFFDLNGNVLGIVSEVLESPITAYEVSPMTHLGLFSDTADHVSGGSDGNVVLEYVNYDDITGHPYEVTFKDDDSWSVQDLSTSAFVVQDKVGQTPGYTFPIVDGVMVRVQGPSIGVKSIAEVATADGPLAAPDNVNYSLNSTKDWYLEDGAGGSNLARYSWAYPNTHDYEIRFTEGATEYCWDWFGGPNGDYGAVNPYKVPIEVWDIGVGTPDDASDDKRITFLLYKGTESDQFAWGDGLYFDDIDYDDVDWTDPENHSGNYDPEYDGWTYRRFFFDDYSGALDRPAAGTIIRISTNKVNTTADVYRFTTQKIDQADGTFLPLSLDEVKTVPNPYYAYFDFVETDQFDRVMKFINMPAKPMTIKIFNIAGDLVRTMERSGAELESPEYVWDLKTDNGLWVASGIYVWLIEAEGLGSRFGKMAIFTEVEQLNNF